MSDTMLGAAIGACLGIILGLALDQTQWSLGGWLAGIAFVFVGAIVGNLRGPGR